jgi:hypothetical protein
LTLASRDQELRAAAKKLPVKVLPATISLVSRLTSDHPLTPAPCRHHDACMRTTLTLDPDVAAKAKEGAAKLGKPFKEVINAALRLGLEQVLRPPISKPYRTHARPLGQRRGLNYDNISELLARAEGEDYR